MPDTEEDRLYMLAILDTFDPQPADATLPYVDVLYRVQALILAALREPLPPPDGWDPGEGQPSWPPGQPPPELPADYVDPRGQCLYAAVGHFAPQPSDRSLEPIQVAKRLQQITNRELSKWTSGVWQPHGPAGSAAAKPPPPADAS